MYQPTAAETAVLLAQDFEVAPQEAILTEEQLLQLLTPQVQYWIDHKLDFLLSLMYRLDILEHKIQAALSPEAALPPAVGVAQLIIDRQKQRIATKKTYQSPPLSADDDEGLGF